MSRTTGQSRLHIRRGPLVSCSTRRWPPLVVGHRSYDVDVGVCVCGCVRVCVAVAVAVCVGANVIRHTRHVNAHTFHISQGNMRVEMFHCHSCEQVRDIHLEPLF